MDQVQLTPAVAASLETWHRIVQTRDAGLLHTITHPEATFRSPVAFKPYHSVDALVLVIGTVITVFEDFAYHRQAIGSDGKSVVLEFSARIGDKGVKGIDFIQFNDEGQIIDFEVMMRPLNGIQALAEQMSARLAHLIPAFKS